MAVNEAAQSLAEIDPDGGYVAPLLLKRLSDLGHNEPERTWSLLWALEKIAGRSPEVGEAIIERTRDTNVVIRQQATQALSGLKTAESRVRLLELLHDGDKQTRFYAAFSLARIQVYPDEAIPVFIEALEDGGSADRGNAACYLKEFGARVAPAIPLLITRLRDRDSDVQCWVAKAIVAAKDAVGENIKALAALLGDKDAEVRELAAEVIAEIGPSAAPAVPALVEALSNQDVGFEEERRWRRSLRSARARRRPSRHW